MRSSRLNLSTHPALRRSPSLAGFGLFNGLQALAELERSMGQSTRSTAPELRFRPIHGEAEGPDGNTVQNTEPVGWVSTVEVPGADVEDLHLDVKDRVLTVSLKRAVDPPEGKRALRRERRALRLSRRIELPEDIDTEGIVATLKDGVLTLRLPRRAPTQARTIPVLAA